MSNTWESDSGNVSDVPATQTTTENKYVQFVVPSFSLLENGPSPNVALPNAVPNTVATYGNSFLRMGSFPAPNATDPASFPTSFALANKLVATAITADQEWDAGNVSDSEAMLTRGGVWDHTDGNRVVTTFGDKIEVVNGNYAFQVNGTDTVPVTSSTSAPIVSTLVGSPGSPIGGSAPPGTDPLTDPNLYPAGSVPGAGQMPSTANLQMGDVFAGTWANRIMTYTGSQGNTVPFVYSATYAGTIASVTTASAILSVTTAADITSELVALTQQSSSQIGVDATLYMAGASVELDIIGMQASQSVVATVSVSGEYVGGLSSDTSIVGGACMTSEFVGGLSTDISVVVGASVSSLNVGLALESNTFAGGAIVSMTEAGVDIASVTIAGAGIQSSTAALGTINNMTTAGGIITNVNTAPNTINLMNGISTDIHAGVHIDNHPMSHVDVHVGPHIALDDGKITLGEAVHIRELLGADFDIVGTSVETAEGAVMKVGATIQMM
jgi:hypothetical protein